MTLMICPGCGESFEAEERIAVVPDAQGEMTPIQMQHFRSPDGRLFCCDECFEVNG